MIREVIKVKAFDILVKMQFFESAHLKALLHLEYLSIKLTNTLVMHALILLPDLREGLFDFIVSFLFINGDRLQMWVELPLALSFGMLQGFYNIKDGIFKVMRV